MIIVMDDKIFSVPNPIILGELFRDGPGCKLNESADELLEIGFVQVPNSLSQA